MVHRLPDGGICFFSGDAVLAGMRVRALESVFHALRSSMPSAIIRYDSRRQHHNEDTLIVVQMLPEELFQPALLAGLNVTDVVNNGFHADIIPIEVFYSQLRSVVVQAIHFRGVALRMESAMRTAMISLPRSLRWQHVST